MTRSLNLKCCGVLAGLAGALALSGTAAAGSGAPVSVQAVEGRPFSGAVATYTSSVTLNKRFVAQAYDDVLAPAAMSSELGPSTRS